MKVVVRRLFLALAIANGVAAGANLRQLLISINAADTGDATLSLLFFVIALAVAVWMSAAAGNVR